MCVCDTFSWCFPWKFSSSHLTAVVAVVAVNDILNSRRCERFCFEASKQEENWRARFELRAASSQQQHLESIKFRQRRKNHSSGGGKMKIERKVWFFSTIFIFHSFLVQKFLWSVCVGFGSFYIMLKNLFFPFTPKLMLNKNLKMLKLIQKSERVMANKKQLNQHGLKILDFMKGRKNSGSTWILYLHHRKTRHSHVYARGIQNNEGGSRRKQAAALVAAVHVWLLFFFSRTLESNEVLSVIY